MLKAKLSSFLKLVFSIGLGVYLTWFFFENMSKEEIYDDRKTKFLQIGRDKGFRKSSNLKNDGLGYKQSIAIKFKFHIISNKYIYLGFGLVTLAGLISLIY